MKLFFTIDVHLTGFTQIKNQKIKINFINFDGTCNTPFFNGSIIDGGVDTQKYEEGKDGTLSARYILKGTDKNGKETLIFIENNGFCKSDGTITTTPFITSDNEELNQLFEGKFSGKVVPQETPEHDRVLIEIYKED